MSISVIIITKNEPNLISLIDDLRGKVYEIIIVNCGEILEISGVKIINNAPKNRGKQLNLGINLATGDKFWFLHSDSKIPKNFKFFIEKFDLGCFKIKFDKKNFFLYFIALFSNLRVQFRNIAFGDQGIFISKTIYEKVGGFRDFKIMEDYDFSIRIKKLGYKFNLADSTIITSASKFKKNALLVALKMQILQYKFRHKIAIERLENEYEKI